MERDKVQNDKVQSNDEISDKDLDKVAGGIGIAPQAKSDGCGPCRTSGNIIVISGT